MRVEEFNGVQEVNFQGCGLSEIDISEMAMDFGSNQMKKGLNEIVRGMKIVQGDDEGVLGNGESSRGSHGIYCDSVACRPQPR